MSHLANAGSMLVSSYSGLQKDVVHDVALPVTVIGLWYKINRCVTCKCQKTKKKKNCALTHNPPILVFL